MDKASFDTSKELFTIEVRAGRKLARSDVERVIARRAKAQGLTYRVVWAAADEKNTTLANKGVSFTAPLLAGGSYDLSKALGSRPVVLTFWASWCAPCLEESPHLQRLFATYGAKGVELVAVSTSKRATRTSSRLPSSASWRRRQE